MEAGVAIAAALKSNCTLKSLDLSGMRYAAGNLLQHAVIGPVGCVYGVHTALNGSAGVNTVLVRCVAQ